MDDNPAFNEAYWNSQPPHVRALRGVESEDERASAAYILMAQGYAIDAPIMIWGWDPFKTMLARESYGFTWLPRMGGETPWQNNPELPGYAPYNPNRPAAGAITITSKIEHYPAFDPPKPPVPARESYVGPYQGAGVYSSLSGDSSRDGDVVNNAGGSFAAHVVDSPFGIRRWYTKAG